MIALGCASSLVLLAALAATVDGPPPAVDLSLHAWFVHHRPSWLTDVAIAITDTGTGLVAYGLAGIAGALWLGGQAPQARRRLRGMVVGVLGLAAAQLGRAGLAAAIARPRPPRADWAYHAGGYAFPSGHTTSAATVAVLITAALARSDLWVALRRAGTVAAVTWAVAVGLSRMYLGVHWPSDVLGSWLFVAALISAMLLVRPGRALLGFARAGDRTSPARR